MAGETQLVGRIVKDYDFEHCTAQISDGAYAALEKEALESVENQAIRVAAELVRNAQRHEKNRP